MKCQNNHRFTVAVATVAALSVCGIGFAPAASAGVVSTTEAIQLSSHQDRLTKVATLLKQEEVAGLLVEHGVQPEAVAARLDRLTGAELVRLEQALESGIAGGDALGLIGAVFLVLLILELVGVTDVFKSI